jgi:pimeloyl-ACP methyl ester carboxylesterase
MKNTLVANGRRLAYRLRGRSQKTPLVLLHGFCEDSGVWDPLMPHLRGLRVLRVDLPGFGGSDLPLTHTMDAYADAVCAVLNELDLSKAVLVGHSMGGYAALAFAAKYPERLAGLGLFHSHPFADPPERQEIRRRGIEQVLGGKKDLYVGQLIPGLFTPAYADAHPEVVRRLIRRGRKNEAEGIAAALQAMIDRPDRAGLLSMLACPVLFVLGEADPLAPPDLVLPVVSRPAVADLHVLPSVAHMGMFEASEECGGILRGFRDFCALDRSAASAAK